MSALEAAREELRQRLADAYRVEDYATVEWLNPLFDVADMVCRVGDHDHSTHYQAEKVGAMVADAVRLRREVHRRHAGDVAGDVLHELSTAARDVEDAVTNAMWSVSRSPSGAGVDFDCLRALASAAGDLAGMVERLRPHGYQRRDEE